MCTVPPAMQIKKSASPHSCCNAVKSHAMLYPLIRKFFFALDAETAHGIGMDGIAFLNATGLAGCLTKPVTPCPVDAMGLRFPNPVGLAAGLDKNGDHIDGLARLGFGFIEIGTVTPRPQDGNPRPRLFRIPEAQGIINRMGFNNAGVDKLLENVRAAEFPKNGGILGINIGKNATTPIERAADDYLICLNKVYADASYIAVNISSPNTKNLRELQKDEALDDLLAQLKARQEILAESTASTYRWRSRSPPTSTMPRSWRSPMRCAAIVWTA